MRCFIRVLTVIGFSSVCLLNAPCTYGGHGVSLIPNNVPNPFTPLLYTLAKGLLT